MHFTNDFERITKERGRFCVGIDPSEKLLGQWGLSIDADGLRKFVEIMVEAAEDKLAIVKPQSAYFEQFGPEGAQILADTVTMFQERGTLTIIDVKRGDIGSTNMAYAKSFFGPKSGYNTSAVTVSAYLGIEALEEFFAYAADHGGTSFVVVRSSNPEGIALQNAVMENGRKMYEHLADYIATFNAKYKDQAYGPIGGVIGATNEDAKEVAALMPHTLFLCPGIGAQGAKLSDMPELFGPYVSRTIPSASRSILSSGPDIGALREAMNQHIAESKG